MAAYSPRIRPGLPVSAPVGWDALDAVRPADFTVRSARTASPPSGRPSCPEPQVLPADAGRGGAHHPDRAGARRCTRASGASGPARRRATGTDNRRPPSPAARPSTGLLPSRRSVGAPAQAVPHDARPADHRLARPGGRPPRPIIRTHRLAVQYVWCRRRARRAARSATRRAVRSRSSRTGRASAWTTEHSHAPAEQGRRDGRRRPRPGARRGAPATMTGRDCSPSRCCPTRARSSSRRTASTSGRTSTPSRPTSSPGRDATGRFPVGRGCACGPDVSRGRARGGRDARLPGTCTGRR